MYADEADPSHPWRRMKSGVAVLPVRRADFSLVFCFADDREGSPSRAGLKYPSSVIPSPTLRKIRSDLAWSKAPARTPAPHGRDPRAVCTKEGRRITGGRKPPYDRTTESMFFFPRGLALWDRRPFALVFRISLPKVLFRGWHTRFIPRSYVRPPVSSQPGPP